MKVGEEEKKGTFIDPTVGTFASLQQQKLDRKKGFELEKQCELYELNK